MHIGADLAGIVEQILRERSRSILKHGLQEDLTDHESLAILAEEFGECGRELCPNEPEKGRKSRLAKEVMQCAAVCLRWLERLRAEYEERCPGDEPDFSDVLSGECRADGWGERVSGR